MKIKENQLVDIFKLIFSFSIFFCHLKSSASWNECSNVLSQLYWIYYYNFNRLIVPCFFIFSGFFLEMSLEDCKEKINYKIYLCKYEKRLFFLYLSWSILYLPYIASKYNLKTIAQRFFFYGTINHLWYLTSLFFSVLFIWWFKQSCKEKYLAFIAFGFYMIGYLCKYMSNTNFVIAYTNIFLTFGNGLFFGMLFVFLGALLRKNRLKVKEKCYKSLILIFITSIVCLVIENRIDETLHIQSLHYIALIPASFALACLIIKAGEDITITVNTKFMRTSSTVIYCSHFWGFYMSDVVFENSISILDKCIITLVTTFFWCLVLIKYGKKSKILRLLY